MKEKDTIITKKPTEIESLRKGEEEKNRLITTIRNARNWMRIIKGENEKLEKAKENSDLIIKKHEEEMRKKNERIKRVEKDKRELINIIVNLGEQTKNIISTTRATYEEVMKEIEENRGKKQETKRGKRETKGQDSTNWN